MLAKYVDGESETDDANEIYTYDGLGRMLTATKVVDSNTISETAFAYNDIGKITDTNETIFGVTKEIDYTYDQAGYPKSIKYPVGTFTVNITPDWQGRIDTVKYWTSTVATYKYIGSRVAQRSYPTPDITYQPSYDNLGRITSARTYKDSNDIVKFNYEYDPNINNISRQIYDHRTNPTDPCTDFTYDNLDRLTAAEYGIDDSNEAFTMDELGNRTNVNVRDGNDITYTVDDLTNRYTSIADANLTYDAAGNLTKDQRGYEYEYDYESRIVKITKDGNDIAEFAYDALGRRVEKKDLIDPNNTRCYYYNYKWQALCQYDENGAIKEIFVYGNYIDEVLFRPLYIYYVHDHLYSPVALVYATGTVIERYEYDAYGKCDVLEPNFAPDPDGQSDYGNPYLFTGRRVDILDSGSLKIQYNRNRYYDYYSGRWLTHDPLGIVPNSQALNYFKPDNQYLEGLSLYEYVSSAPTIGIDPWGMEEESSTYQVDGPVPPWPPYPDVGRAPWWLPEPPGLRTAERVLYALAFEWALLGYYDGAYFLAHWLDGTGWPVVADYRRMLKDSYGARAAFMTELEEAQDAAKALVTGSESGPKQITSIKRDTVGEVKLSDDFNWYAAIKKHRVWGRGNVRKGKRRQSCCYYMDITIHMCDKFNFDIREIKDAVLIPARLLEYYGYAKSFRSAGKHKISVTWIKGYRWEHDHPRSIIQGIQKPVPQCQ